MSNETKNINLENLQRYDENIKKTIPKIVELTQTEYDALSSEEQNNGTTYFIKDGKSSGEGESSSEIGGEGSQTIIMYAVNDEPITIGNRCKAILTLQFGSTSGESVVFITLNPTMTTAEELKIKIVIDLIVYHEFSYRCTEGKNIISINYPLINLSSGGHILTVEVMSGTATGVFDTDSAYLTLIGNGILVDAKWNGIIQIKEEVGCIPIYQPDKISIVDIKENLNVKTQSPIPIKINEEVGCVDLNQPDKIIINGIGERLDTKLNNNIDI